MPSQRTPLPKVAVRATSTAIRFAIDVPVTNRPLAVSGKLNISRTHCTTCRSHFDWNLIAPRKVRIQAGREHLSQHSGRSPTAVNPSHKSLFSGCTLPTEYGRICRMKMR